MIIILFVSCLIDCGRNLRCINKGGDRQCDVVEEDDGKEDDGMNCNSCCNKIERIINRLQNSFESMQYEMLQMKAQLGNMNSNYQSESDTTY